MPQNNSVSSREHAQFRTKRRLNSINGCNTQAKDVITIRDDILKDHFSQGGAAINVLACTLNTQLDIINLGTAQDIGL